MTDHGDQLREAFKTHEDRTPDPAVVYARVEELARTYRWRRRGAQAAGGAVLGAGLIAGVLTVPGLVGPPPQDGFPMVAPAAAPSSVAPTPPSEADMQRWFDAYYQAGYDYDDAVTLAKMWKRTDGDMSGVKAEAGRRLLAGETLPVQPTPDDPEQEPESDPVAEARFRAFFDEGYVYEDAEKLARLWKIDDPSAAKIEAGKRLLAGQKLPVKPKPANVAAALDGKRVSTFFGAGYDIDDAVKLAELWKLDSAYDAKIEGGKRLMAGDELPIRP